MQKNESSSLSAILSTITSELDENKAENLITINLIGKSSIADYMVIASGTSARHVISLAKRLGETLKENFNLKSSLEGEAEGDWVLLDTGDIIVHLFRPEVRDFYQLEKMWAVDVGAASGLIHSP